MSSTYEEPELADIAPPSVCKVKLVKNTKGVNFEVSVVEGADANELDRIRLLAVAQMRALEAEFPEA